MSVCICGMNPHSHQCPASEFYYSPEQERYDDMMDDGSDDHRERYAAEMNDIHLEWLYDRIEEADRLTVTIDEDDLIEAQNDPRVQAVLDKARATFASSMRLDPDDIPF